MSVKKIRLLPGMKFMSGGVLYRPGDILPDTEDSRNLAERGRAEWIGEEIAAVLDGYDGYEEETVKNLVSLAKERDIDIPKGTNKAGIIELLRDWDAQNEGDA
ncbi:MAG: hypothetical protein LBQ42_07470 [Synergistaceae bacterium]|jgi:hypothetical protein|nr:hypothetical protein [Synergistaceae bacterium]